MPTREEFRIRQLILDEYRNGSSIQQALVNISPKVDSDFISYWYQRFKSGNVCLFDPESEQYGITATIQKVSNGKKVDFIDSILCIHNTTLYNPSSIVDGRCLIELKTRSPTELIYHDLFNGTKKEINLRWNHRQILYFWVISSHRLIITKSNGLVLLKFDSKSGEVISVSDAVSDPIKRPKIIIDHSNEDNFLIYNFASFASGSLEDDKIVLGPVQQFNIDFLKCPKLIGNNIYGFGSLVQNEDGDRFIQYLKVDLITLTKETIEVPFNLNDDRVILNLKNRKHCWIGTILYAIVRDKDNRMSIVVFDSEKLTFTRTEIRVYGNIFGLSVNENHFLTIQATKVYDSDKHCIYRFALKIPESLINLVWFTIRRSAILFDGKDYEKIRDRFPVLMP